MRSRSSTEANSTTILPLRRPSSTLTRVSKLSESRSARSVSAGALTRRDGADRLSDNFDTRVKVELGRRKGKIVVEFASVDDLERIIGLMVPGLSPRTGPTGE